MSRKLRPVKLVAGVLLIIAICVAFYYVAVNAVAIFFTERSSSVTTGTTSAEDAAAAAVQAAKLKSTQELQAIIDTMTLSYGSTDIAIVLTDLSNDASASVNADTQFVSASIYKLFVAYGIYQEVDAGTIKLTDKMTGYAAKSTVDECLDMMITISDNTCAVALGELYGWSKLDAMLASAGYSKTKLDNYDEAGNLDSDKQTTANDVAKLLRSLYDGTLLGATATKQFIAYLKADQINYMLPSGLPDGTVFAHKVGYLEDYQHDAGIVYGDNGDVLVVMLTKGWGTPTTDAAAAFKALGEAVWSYMSS